MARINSSTLTSNYSWRSVHLSLAVFTTLVILAEVILHLLPQPLPSRTIQSHIPEIINLPTPDIQIYGESVTHGAINDWVLAEALGMNLSQIRNDSVPSTSAFFAYAQLKRQVAAGHIPHLLILGYVARSYTVPMVPKFLSHVASASEIAEISLSICPPLETTLQGLLGKFSFGYRHRSEYNDLLRQRFSKEALASFTTPSIGILARQQNLPHSIDEAGSEQDYRQAVAMTRFHDLKFAPPNEQKISLQRFFALARRHQIRVLLLSMPKPSIIYQSHKDSGFNAAYDDFLNSFISDGNVERLVREQKSLPPTDFIDGVHLTKSAGFRFSQQVATSLKGHLLQKPL